MGRKMYGNSDLDLWFILFPLKSNQIIIQANFEEINIQKPNWQKKSLSMFSMYRVEVNETDNLKP